MTNDKTRSIAVSPLTMAAALAAADPVIAGPGGRIEWVGNPDNSQQEEWLASFRRRAELARQLPEISSHATVVLEEHARWLKAQGWDAQVSRGLPNDLYLAATLDFRAKWSRVGRAYRDSDSLDRVSLAGCQAFPGRGEHPVVEVPTAREDLTFLFFQSPSVEAGFEHLALRHAVDEMARARCLRGKEVTLDFPMVDLAYRDDARYMLGLRSGPNVVSQACEQLRLELDETGGRARAAAEIAVSRGFSPATVVRIDGPFVVAVVLDSLPVESRVMFAAYVDRDAWRRPGSSIPAKPTTRG